MCDSLCKHCFPKAETLLEYEEAQRTKEAAFMLHMTKHGVAVEACEWCALRDRARGADR